MIKVDWEAIGKDLPRSSQQLLKLISDAYNRAEDDPAREVEMALKEQIASLKKRFDALKGDES